MAQALSSKTFMAFTTESVYGTPVDPASGGYNRCKRNTVKNRSTPTSGNRNFGVPWASCVRIHQKRSSGEVAFDMSYQGFDRYYLHMFGAASDSYVNGGGTDEKVGIHTFSPKIAQVVGGTLHSYPDILAMKYPGQKITQMRFNFRRNDPLEMVLQMLGLDHTIDPPVSPVPASPTFLEETPSSGTNAIPCINPIEGGGKGFKFEVGTAGGTGYSTVGMIDGDFTIDKPHLDSRGNMGSARLAEPIPNGEPFMNFTGNIRKEFLDDSFILPFIQGIQKAFRWTYESNQIIDATSGTLYYKWVLEAKYVRWLEAPPEVPGPGPIEDNLPFVCESPDGTTPPCTLVSTNGIIATTT